MPKQLAKIQQFTIPLTSWSVGVHGPVSSGNLPTSLNGYEIDLQNDATWPVGDPANPKTVCQFIIEASVDAGQTWSPDAQFNFGDQGWVTKEGGVITPTNTAVCEVSLPSDQVTTRRVRVTLNVLIACRLGAVVSSF